MPGRATDLLVIDGSFWKRSDVIEALHGRDIGRLFRLLAQYAGASQTRLAIACELAQPKVSAYMRGTARVEALEVFERIADGLAMPDRAEHSGSRSRGAACQRWAGYPATEYQPGIASCRRFQSAQRTCSRQRGGRGPCATANLRRTDRRVPG
jgi:hypothetical protein